MHRFFHKRSFRRKNRMSGNQAEQPDASVWRLIFLAAGRWPSVFDGNAARRGTGSAALADLWLQ